MRVNDIELVCISGWATRGEILRPLAERLSVAIPSPCDAITFLDWADSLADDGPLSDALRNRSRPVVLLAWSLGAMLGLRALSRRPAPSLKAAILIGGAGAFLARDNWPGVEPRMLTAMLLRLRRRPESVVRDFAQQCLHGDASDDFVAMFQTQASDFSGSQLQRGLEFLREFDVRDGLRRIETPTLVLHGEADGIVPRDAGRRLAEALPDAVFHEIPAGHALPVLHQTEAADAIRAFLQRFEF